jgi:hypothetical protein
MKALFQPGTNTDTVSPAGRAETIVGFEHRYIMPGEYTEMMTGILELKGLSSEAKIGKIILIVSLILSIIAVIIVILAGQLVAKVLQGIPGLFVAGLYILALVKIAGIILGFFSLHSTTTDHWRRAGILALVSCILPPLDLLMLVSGLFFLFSPEAKAEEH